MLARGGVTDAPPIVRALGWTRAIGRCADFAASTLAGFALGHLLGHGRLGTGLGAVAGGLSALRWTSRTAGRAIQRERPELGSSLEAYLEGKGGILRPHLERWLTARVRPAWVLSSVWRSLPPRPR